MDENQASVETRLKVMLGRDYSMRESRPLLCQAINTQAQGNGVIASARTWGGVLKILREQAQGPGQAGNQEADHVMADPAGIYEERAYREVADICERKYGPTVCMEHRWGRCKILRTVKPTVRSIVADEPTWAGVLKVLQEQSRVTEQLSESPDAFYGSSTQIAPKVQRNGGYSPEMAELVRAARKAIGFCDAQHFALARALKPFGSVES